MIKAIETVYKGYRFRSRTEARWAVFFDAQGIEWSYELEGYDLDGTWYLPDFWLPQVSMWGEVKGTVFNLDEIDKARRLALGTGHGVLKLIGVPECKPYWAIEPCREVDGSTSDWDYALTTRYLESEQRFWSACGGCRDCTGCWTDTYVSAIEAARQARFEHGETPR